MEQREKSHVLFRTKENMRRNRQMLENVHGNEDLSRMRVFEGFQRFGEGREDLEDHLRNGRPSTM